MNTVPMFGEHCLARLDVRICRNCAYDENYHVLKGVFNTLCLIRLYGEMKRKIDTWVYGECFDLSSWPKKYHRRSCSIEF